MILLRQKLQVVSVKDMAETIGLGQETLKDIIADLLKPGRDLRDDFEAPVLRQDVLDISDLEIGQNWKELFEMWSILEPLLISVFTMMA